MTSEFHNFLTTEAALAGAACALDRGSVGGTVEPAERVLRGASRPSRSQLAALRRSIRAGEDPLGEAFTRLRSPEVRRPMGATYTPAEVVAAMCSWADGQPCPDRIVDAGAGSGRFSLSIARTFPKAQLVAIELDPLAALILRGNLAAAGLADRATVISGDYRELDLPEIDGPTLYIGNPPYVRHHQISASWKEWLDLTAQRHGLSASKLAGLHVHFFLATLEHARPGDFGSFITSAEWLDVNYGALVRDLLLAELGGVAVHMLEPTAMPFADAATTAAITNFRVGDQPSSLRLRRVEKVADLKDLRGGKPVRRERLAEAKRWTPFFRSAPKLREDFVELGELCRVHRGAVTGANHIWIASDTTKLPDAVLQPAVTKARELFNAGTHINDRASLRRVIDLPRNLDDLPDEHRDTVDRFLSWAEKKGARQGYIARHRPSWWSVDLRSPAPILATYMARRPPAFVRNLVDARHINIAHGLYPRQDLTSQQLAALAHSLRSTVTTASGRTYAGGLTKFEPREMERLPVPTAEALSNYDAFTSAMA